MSLSKEHKSIFIHIPKNGGTSVCEALGMGKSYHYTYRWYNEEHPDKWAQWFKFAIVRNPWDRLVSCYEYAKAEESYWHNNIGKKLNPHPDFELIKRISFKETVDILHKYRGHRILRHAGWLPQVHWLWNDTLKKESVVDEIYRLEDLSPLEKRFNIKLKKINATNKKNYKEYYTPELVDKVSEIYAKDINLLKYEF